MCRVRFGPAFERGETFPPALSVGFFRRLSVQAEHAHIAVGVAANAKALILQIESPGGTTVGSERVFDAIREVAAKKPVVATVDTLAASGAITSGLGYVLWYAALPALTTVSAAVIQLSVPILSALGGVLLLAEPLSSRLVISSATIMGGIALTILRRRT